MLKASVKQAASAKSTGNSGYNPRLGHFSGQAFFD